MEEKIQKPGLMMVMKRPSLRQFSWLLGGSLLLGACSGFGWRCSSRSHAGDTPGWQGIGMPDGFSVWHHLDANGIRFKSIPPQKDGLLIKFDSPPRARRRKKFSAALCHMVILLPC